MRIIFCNSPLNSKTVEPDYENEYISAKKNGFNISLINFEALLDSNFSLAFKNISNIDSPERAIFRGWMLKPDKYEILYNQLKNKNIILINTLEQYTHCHYLPDSYELMKNYTPNSVWLNLNNSSEIDFSSIMDLLKVFNGKPIIVKDYVKSQKHKWLEACYISDSSNETIVKQIVNNFLQLQGSELNIGLVFRELIEFESIGEHPKSKMPLTKEYRLFFLNGELLSIFKYWSEGVYDNEDEIDLEKFTQIAKTIKSSFFTMDIAKSVDGRWYIIELGDGQCAGLPDINDSDDFYTNLSNKNIL